MTPNILEPDMGINMLFGAKRVKMIRLQLYGSDFANSVRKKMAVKKPVGVVTTPLGSARANSRKATELFDMEYMCIAVELPFLSHLELDI